eukprot:2851964-Rhodomonas_salina.4
MSNACAENVEVAPPAMSGLGITYRAREQTVGVHLCGGSHVGSLLAYLHSTEHDVSAEHCLAHLNAAKVSPRPLAYLPDAMPNNKI